MILIPASGSIQKKVTRLMMITSGISLFIACFAFIIYDAINVYHDLPRQIGTVANILSLELISAVDFRDEQTIRESVNSLKGEHSIIAAGVYNNEGSPTVTYNRDKLSDQIDLPLHMKNAINQHYFKNKHLYVVRRIQLQERYIGAIVIQADISEATTRITKSLIIILFVFMIAIVLTMAFSRKFQKVITIPILQLSEKAQEVSLHKDYSLRVKKLTDDELGLLVDNFNDMLSQIQNRDNSLRKLNEELEERVRRRTEDLIKEIQERKIAEEEVRKLNVELEARVVKRTEQLEAAYKELESFAYTVSHDLRAPLRHVNGFAQLLEGCYAQNAAESTEYLGYINESIHKMDCLINDLLSFSRMGRQGMNFVTVAMGPLVQDVIKEFAPEVRERNIVWKIATLPEVTGDPAMLKVVMVNLIGNALKYSRNREVTEININFHLSNDQKEYIFCVKDNGVGFNMKYIDKLYGVFHRLHSENEFEGTGIGLATIRRIIERHMGRTWAEGEVNRGATFYFSLPNQSSMIS